MMLRLLLFVFLCFPGLASACADGCGVFDVGTSSVLPTDSGGSVWMEYNFADQNKAWRGNSATQPSEELHHKNVRTNYYNAGGQYMFNRSWGMRAVVPFVDRSATSEDHDTGGLVNARRFKLGDARVTGIYSGFSHDMSTGVTFGLRLPTGDHSDAVFDRDTAIGSGSTNLQLGAYRMGRINMRYGWFANTLVDTPIAYKGDYRPGTEWTAAAGAYRNGWYLDGHHVTLTPIMQVIASKKWHDGGVIDEDHPHASGFTQILVSPGFEFKVHDTTFYSDVSIPVYRHVEGTQLIAPVFAKMGLRYRF